MGTKYWQFLLVLFFLSLPMSGTCATQSGTSPVVSLTVPPPGRIIAGPVLVAAAASAGVAGVQFKLDGQNLGSEITTPPFSMIWNTTSASNGPHTLTAEGRDAAGNQAIAPAVTITLDNTLNFLPPSAAPSVSITVPPPGRIIAGSVLVAAAASEGVVGVQFKLDGRNLGSEITTPPFSMIWNTTSASNGPHTLTAEGRDAVGNQAIAPAVTITVDNTLNFLPPSAAPSVSITVPPPGRIIAGSVLVAAAASAGVVGVQFKLDGQNLGSEITTPPFSMIWNTTSAANSSHTVTAVARDTAGSQATTAVTVTVDNTLGFLPPSTSTRPTLAYSFSGAGANSWMSTSASSEPQIGYVRIQSNPTSVTPSGVAIIGLRQNGVLVTEAGIPASLPIRNGRCYIEVTDRLNTALAIANPNNQDAVVSFYFTDNSGSNYGYGSFTVSANHQIAAFINQSPFNSGPPGTATLTFTSSVPVSAVALRSFSNDRNDFLFSALPVINLDIQNSAEQVVVPHFASGGGWRSQIVLVNPTDLAISGDLQVLGQGQLGGAAPPLMLTVDGVADSTFHYAIAPHGLVRMVTESGIGSTQVGSIHVTSAQHTVAPSTFAIVSFVKDGRTVSEASIETLSPALTFRTYAQSFGLLGEVGSIQTAVAIANPSAAPVEASLELLGLDGTSTGLSTTITIPDGGQSARFIRELFPQLGLSFEGVLKVKSTAPLVMTALRERVNERSESIFTTTPPVNDETFTNPEVAFPLTVSGGGYNTQFVLLGISAEPAISGNVWMLSSSGTALEGPRN